MQLTDKIKLFLTEFLMVEFLACQGEDNSISDQSIAGNKNRVYRKDFKRVKNS